MSMRPPKPQSCALLTTSGPSTGRSARRAEPSHAETAGSNRLSSARLTDVSTLHTRATENSQQSGEVSAEKIMGFLVHALCFLTREFFWIISAIANKDAISSRTASKLVAVECGGFKRHPQSWQGAALQPPPTGRVLVAPALRDD